jgi:hypothetical protein
MARRLNNADLMRINIVWTAPMLEFEDSSVFSTIKF